MECPSCNQPVTADERFCGACGTQVSYGESAAPVPAMPTAPLAGPRRCMKCGHVGLAAPCLRCGEVMQFIPRSQLEVEGARRQVCVECCTFVVGKRFCSACGSDMATVRSTIPTARARMLASGFESIGLLETLSDRTVQSIGLSKDEVVLLAIDLAGTSKHLTNVVIELCYKTRSPVVHIVTDAIVVTDRRIIGLVSNKEALIIRAANKRAMKKGHGYRDCQAGYVYERDLRTLSKIVWDMNNNPVKVNFDCQQPGLDLESFIITWRVGLSAGKALLGALVLTSQSHTMADRGEAYIWLRCLVNGLLSQHQ